MITEVSIQYANALFELASEEEKQEFLNNLEVVTQAIIQDEEVFKVFEHPQIASSKKKEIIINVFKNKVSDVFTNFLLVIIDHKRINELNNIKDAYELILNNHLKVLDATVYSKYPLTDIQKNNLTQTLKEHYQKDIRINDTRRTLGWINRGAGSSAGELTSEDTILHTGFTGTNVWVDRKNELHTCDKYCLLELSAHDWGLYKRNKNLYGCKPTVVYDPQNVSKVVIRCMIPDFNFVRNFGGKSRD